MLEEKDRDLFKSWLLPKLETISDADASVLADYVIALISAETTEAGVKRNCLESLPDFLQDNTGPLVDDILKVIKNKSYVSRSNTKKSRDVDAKSVPTPAAQPTAAPQTAPIPSIVGTSASEYSPASALSTEPPLNALTARSSIRNSAISPPNGPPVPDSRPPDRLTSPFSKYPQVATPFHNWPKDKGGPSRKRKLNDRETSQPRDNQEFQRNRVGDSERPFKQVARRAGRNDRAGLGAPLSRMPPMPAYIPTPPTPPAGIPPFDPTNPMAFMAMAAALGMGFPPFPFGEPGSNSAMIKEKCKNYEAQGFCALGSACPYEHGGGIVVPANEIPEYDPNRSSLAVESKKAANGRRGNRGRNHGETGFGGRPRAPFSLSGPSHDRSNTTVVVEQIPDECFSEDSVRAFFSQFGEILDVQMQAYKHLAIVKFEDYGGASRAYNSPKAVFDNRFVKVYWYKPESVLKPNGEESSSHGEDTQDDEMVDLDAIEKRQAEYQKAFEERKKKTEEVELKAEDIDKQIRETDEEMRKLRRELAVLEGKDLDEVELEDLMAEAQGLFAKHDTDTDSPRGRGRGRGAFRGSGRGSGYSTPRGRGYTSFRGGYHGRGFMGAPFNGSRVGVKRWDNRPKRIAIGGIEAGSKKDELVRQYLLTYEGCTNIDQHMERPDTLIANFKERYMAEMFLDDSLNIPDVGKLELSWVPNDVSIILRSTETDPAPVGQTTDDDSSTIDGDETKDKDVQHGDTDVHVNGTDADMDVADDVDQWL